jgi:ribonuclease D
MHLHRTPPRKEDIAELEPFEGLGLDRISLVTNLAEATEALEVLMLAGELGFDTESKPTFRKGERSTGPHVLQFATAERAYIFQSHVEECLPVVMRLLESGDVKKIGFGLSGDLSHIAARFGIRPSSVVDLDSSFRRLGYRNAVGAKSAIAILFQQRMMKSKTTTTSNWSSHNLSERQLMYAANDAYAAIRVFHAMREGGQVS